MKTSNRIRSQRSATGAAKQAAIPSAKPPAEFKIVRLRELPVDSAEMLDPDAVAKFWDKHVTSAPWFSADKECLVVFLLNTRRHVLGFELLSQGTKDTLLVNVGEVFRLAAMKNASAIIVAHNHPSGDATPSEPDIKVTRDLIRAGALLKIELLDHIVMGDAQGGRAPCSSLRALGHFYDYEKVAGYFVPPMEPTAEATTNAESLTAASAPAPKPKQWKLLHDTKHWQLLVSGCDTTEESLWAALDGRIFIVDEGEDKVREVDFATAVLWFCHHHAAEPYLAQPFYPEFSAANKFCEMVRLMIESGTRAKSVPAAPVPAALPTVRPPGAMFLEMEQSVNEAVALLTAFAYRLCDRDESKLGERGGYAACGFLKLACECADELIATWNAAHDDSRALADGKPVVRAEGKSSAAVRLSNPVAKADVLLMLLAEKVTEQDYATALASGRQIGNRPIDRGDGYFLLAWDCIDRLKAEYYAAQAAWFQLLDAVEQRQAA